MKDLIRKYALQNAVLHQGKAEMQAVLSKLFAADPSVKPKVKELISDIKQIISEVNKLSVEDQRSELEKLAPELLEKKLQKHTTLPELPNAELGKVVMRIAPYPSGPLHIGNAKPLILNDEYAKRYAGKLILAIDDTIGSEEKNISPAAYDLIPEGAEWLGIAFQEKIFKSDRLELYYKYALELIKLGKAYVCTCDSETLRQNREQGRECICRAKPAADVENLWNGMLDGSLTQGSAALRLKTDMSHKNPAFRDRVLLRISDRPHPRVGTKYRVWPMLEFSWAIDDHLLGMTHILRGKDLLMETEMERFIWDIFKWKQPEVIHSGLLSITGVKISKSKSKKEVESGSYFGWDDPRTWSLQSLKRRGIQPAAIRQFITELGIGDSETTVPIDNLYSYNRKLLDSCNRHFFVNDPVEIIIKGAPEQEVKLKLHPDDQRGWREFKTHEKFLLARKDYDSLEDGKLYRLMDCLNFTRKGSEFSFDSRSVDEYRKRGERIMHWLPVDTTLIDVTVLMPDGTLSNGKAEHSVSSLAPGDCCQFERFGFCRLDSPGKFWYAHK